MRKFPMKPVCGGTISKICFFFGVKASEINGLFIVPNYRLPAAVGFFHPRQSSDSLEPMFIYSFAIRLILSICRFSQIFKSVVTSDPVNMIDLISRPLTGHIEPRQPMSGVGLTVNFNENVPFMVRERPSNLPDPYFRPRRFPAEKPCLWLICENFKEMIVRYFVHGSAIPHFARTGKD